MPFARASAGAAALTLWAAACGADAPQAAGDVARRDAGSGDAGVDVVRNDAGADGGGAPDAGPGGPATCAAASVPLYRFDEARRERVLEGVGVVRLDDAPDGGYRVSFPDGSWVDLPVDGFLASVLVAELSGDGVPDVVVAAPWRAEVGVFFGPLPGSGRALVEADVRVAAPTGGGLANLFGLGMIAGPLDTSPGADLLVAAPAEGEVGCLGQEPPRLYRGPLRPGALDRDDAAFELDAEPRACVGDTTACAPGAAVLVGESARSCFSYPLPLDAGAVAGDCPPG